MEIRIFESKEAVAENFCTFLHNLIKKNGEVHIALSGGSTPKIVFNELASEYRDLIPWADVHLYWGDERCVPPTDAESNYRMTKEHLLDAIEIPEANVHRIKGEEEPEEEARRYASVLRQNVPLHGDLPQFDLVILGMGDDGHTASVFPHQIELWDSPNLCEVAVHPDSGQKRITLTGGVINQAGHVAFLVTGSNKSERLREILDKEGNYHQYPASLVAPDSGELLWFLDKAAASEIS